MNNWSSCNNNRRGRRPESPEPPVPAGIGSLPNALRVLASFYEFSDDLLHVAAKESDSVEEPVAKPLPVQAWLEKKSEKQRLLLLEKLLTDDSGIVRADTLQTIRKKMDFCNVSGEQIDPVSATVAITLRVMNCDSSPE